MAWLPASIRVLLAGSEGPTTPPLSTVWAEVGGSFKRFFALCFLCFSFAFFFLSFFVFSLAFFRCLAGGGVGLRLLEDASEVESESVLLSELL